MDLTTFYRAIKKYHEETGVDALLVQTADHNVDAREKLLTSLLNSEHKKAQLAVINGDSALEAHHNRRKEKLQGLLDQHNKNKRLNRD